MPITRDRGRSDGLRAELLGPRRYEVVSLDGIIEVGRVLTGDPEGMAFYGLAPAAWYARGIRLLGRTCVEATPDVTARSIARTVRALLGRSEGVGGLVLSVFALVFVVKPSVPEGQMDHVFDFSLLIAVALGLICAGLYWSIVLFNRPRFLVAAPYRDEVGAWRARRQRRTSVRSGR